ncbi:MAG: ankyrin repeat protein [Chlamydiales bacterium]|jgi:ankyrin repeat protein
MISSPIGSGSDRSHVDLSSLEDGTYFQDKVQEEPEFLSEVLEKLSSDQSCISEHTELTFQAVRLIPDRDLDSDFCSRFFSAVKASHILNEIDDCGDTPLHQALQHEDRNTALSLTKKLLKSGANPLQPSGLPAFMEPSSSHGFSPLEMAANFDDVEITNFMIDHLSDEEIKSPVVDITLCLLCQRSRYDQVIKLLEKGANPHSRQSSNSESPTLLHHAVVGESEALVRLLIESGANPLQLSRSPVERAKLPNFMEPPMAKQISPLELAMDTDNEVLTAFLIDHIAEEDIKDPVVDKVLFQLIDRKEYDLIYKLLDKGANIDAVWKEKRRCNTLLSYAVMQEDKELVEQLLLKGAAVDKVALNSKQPLSIACGTGNIEIALLLIEQGADIHQDTLGNTPLQVACKSGEIRLVHKLLEKGASINSPNDEKLSPAHLAILHGHEELALDLLERGADPKSCDMNGSPLLTSTCYYSRLSEAA